MDKQKKYNVEEVFEKEMNLSEDEIEGYACMGIDQRCLTDCVWPFSATFISSID